MGADSFASNPTQLDSPARSAAAVTPDDNTDLPTTSRALWVGSAGDISVILAGDTVAVTLKAIPAGTLLPICAKRVRATGTTTTAGTIVALS